MPSPGVVDRSPPPPPPPHGGLAALLSYLVPGLGQVIQGRIGKGLLFFVCIHVLFLYGFHLGNRSNVYLPDLSKESNPWKLPPVLADLYNRPHFAAQFWVGVAAWPAIYQYKVYQPEVVEPPLKGLMRQPTERDLQDMQRDGDKTWDLAWVYTVLAGALNVLVIYDAFAGPAFVARRTPARAEENAAHADVAVPART